MFSLNDLMLFNGSMSSHLVSDTDDSTNPKYYGFLAKDGQWYILRENTTSKQYRYVKGTTDYPTNWTNRASLTYDYVDAVFNH